MGLFFDIVVTAVVVARGYALLFAAVAIVVGVGIPGVSVAFIVGMVVGRFGVVVNVIGACFVVFAVLEICVVRVLCAAVYIIAITVVVVIDTVAIVADHNASCCFCNCFGYSSYLYWCYYLYFLCC